MTARHPADPNDPYPEATEGLPTPAWIYRPEIEGQCPRCHGNILLSVKDNCCWWCGWNTEHLRRP